MMNEKRQGSRPARLTIPDFAGRPLTLSDAPQSWQRIACSPDQAADGQDILLLGLGPGKAWLQPFIPSTEQARVFWLEEPRTLALLEAWPQFSANAAGFPGQWRKVAPEDAPRLAVHCQTWFYRPGLRLAPDFWGRLLANIETAGMKGLYCDMRLKFPPRRSVVRLGTISRAALPAKPPLWTGNFISNPQYAQGEGLAGTPSARQAGKSAWLPGNEKQLLHQELRQALGCLGFAAHSQIPKQPNASSLAAIWPGRAPDLAISVNFRGMDPEGRVFHICRALEIPLAIWLVDNPWHLISGQNSPWWRQASIFVTDASFIASLAAAGAKNVWHLPLAASQHMWHARAHDHCLAGPLFVGRSSFPDKNAFFKALRLPVTLWDEALALLAGGNETNLPDWHWWLQKTGVKQLWPGVMARLPGLGADRCSTLNRGRWLQAALPWGLRLAGDEGWREILPQAELLPPVDYYGSLPGLYSQAQAVLNVTSLLLPRSLNQRHFDVWAAGGLLLSDATPGLDLFPPNLTRPMTLATPAEFGRKLAYFNANKNARSDLISAWREHLRHGHAYADRIRAIMDAMGSKPDIR